MSRLSPIPLLALAFACGEPPDNGPEADVYGVANACYTIMTGDGAMQRSGETYALVADAAGTPLFLRPSGLGSYLLYDADGGYVTSEGGSLVRQTELRSDITEFDETYISSAEWILEPHDERQSEYQLRSKANNKLLGEETMVAPDGEAARLTLASAEGCEAPPELELNAEGEVTRTHFDDGTLFGIVDMHSHQFTNYGFGGGLYHGSPFHPLGVEHAMGDCEIHHGVDGKIDFFGYAYDAGNDASSLDAILPALISGELEDPNHITDGYPDFTDWPNARKRATHQVQYYKWIERAYMAGLRLVVQHATTNAVICDITVGAGYAKGRFDCKDMSAVDRQIDAAYAMQDYIDAQNGGPGEGWYQVVTSPEEAREVIGSGKMAVVLGIETSNLFECLLTPRADSPECDLEYVQEQLDEYHGRGVRAIFPVHKYDNLFTPGDGDPDFIEIGNLINSGHYTNMTQDCPEEQMRNDNGPVSFGGFLQPRDDYLAPAPLDFSGITDDPIATLIPYFPKLTEGRADGDYCQNATLTELGESLMKELMYRGMIIEIDHFPQWSYLRAFEMLEEADYPAVGTHGFDHGGKLYDIGGLSYSHFGSCHDPNQPGQSISNFKNRLARMEEAGLHNGLGVAFDLNGFASARGPRFGPEGCGDDQVNPITYPFTSWDGSVTFTEPYAGNRLYDYNTEGMAHLGLFPEYIQNARIDVESDEELEPLFRSAEGYIQMWERAEARGALLKP